MAEFKRTWTPEDVAASNKAECEAQGLPYKITDPVFLRHIAVLFNAGRDERQAS